MLFKRMSHVERYESLKDKLSNEELRELEMNTLVPVKLQKPTCPEAHVETPITRYVKVYFASEEALEEFCKYVTIKRMVERTTRDSGIILDALRKTTK